MVVGEKSWEFKTRKLKRATMSSFCGSICPKCVRLWSPDKSVCSELCHGFQPIASACAPMFCPNTWHQSFCLCCCLFCVFVQPLCAWMPNDGLVVHLSHVGGTMSLCFGHMGSWSCLIQNRIAKEKCELLNMRSIQGKVDTGWTEGHSCHTFTQFFHLKKILVPKSWAPLSASNCPQQQEPTWDAHALVSGLCCVSKEVTNAVSILDSSHVSHRKTVQLMLNKRKFKQPKLVAPEVMSKMSKLLGHCGIDCQSHHPHTAIVSKVTLWHIETCDSVQDLTPQLSVSVRSTCHTHTEQNQVTWLGVKPSPLASCWAFFGVLPPAMSMPSGFATTPAADDFCCWHGGEDGGDDSNNPSRLFSDLRRSKNVTTGALPWHSTLSCQMKRF